MLKSILILFFLVRITKAANFIISKYDLNLTLPHGGNTRYTGNVDISIVFHDGFEILRIPRGNITILQTNLRFPDQKPDTPRQHMNHKNEKSSEYFEYIKVSVKKNVPYFLYIEFEGNLQIEGAGLYPMVYRNRSFTFAAFGGWNAYRSIPCLDEFAIIDNIKVQLLPPEDSFKVIYRLDRTKRYWQEGSDNNAAWDGTTRDAVEYEKIPMSLIGIAHGEFQVATDLTTKSNPTRKFKLLYYSELPIPKDTAEDRVYSQCVATVSSSLSWLEIFLHHRSPVKSLYIFMLPEVRPHLVDNSKYIYYARNSILHINAKNLEYRYKFRLITANKMARMFFGNMLYPQSKKDLWMNHGLSNYLQYKVVAGQYAEYDFKQLMFLESRYHAMKEELTLGVYILNNEGVSERFASRKGGSLFWMLESAISEKTFRKVLRHLIETNREKSVSWSCLVQSLSTFTSEIPNAPSFLQMLHSWINHIGYPIIRVHRLNNNLIRVTQQMLRCWSDHITDRWVVPVKLSLTDLIWAHDNVLKYDNESWNLANLDLQGYYRVDYDKTIWTDIIKKLNSSSFKDITTLNRARLIDDSLNLAYTDYAPYNYNYTIKILDYLQHEDEYLPWAIVYENMKYLLPIIHGTEGATTIQTIVGKHAWAVYNNKKIKTDKVMKSAPPFIFDRFINILFDLACFCGNQNCLDDLKQRNHNEIKLADMEKYKLSTSCCYAVRESEDFSSRVYKAFTANSDQEAKDFYLQCAACDTRYNETIERMNQPLNPYEMNQLFEYMLLKSHGGATKSIMSYLKNYIEYGCQNINGFLREEGHKLRYILESVAYRIFTEEAIKDYSIPLSVIYFGRLINCRIFTRVEYNNVLIILNENRYFRTQHSEAIMKAVAPPEKETKTETETKTNNSYGKNVFNFIRLFQGPLAYFGFLR